MLAPVLLLAGCETAPLLVPTVDDVTSAYQYTGELEVEMFGNVAEVRVFQPSRQLRRGGSLWAKVGPYVFLLSQETKDLFEAFDGLAAVRVVTRAPSGTEVARAMLTRDALNDITWTHAIRAGALARRDGSTKPKMIEDLIRMGEDLTTFEYSSRYVRN